MAQMVEMAGAHLHHRAVPAIPLGEMSAQPEYVQRRKEEIGSLIRSYRKRRGLTQEQLGEMLGIEQPSISRWERGLVPDHFQEVARLIAILQIPPTDLDLEPDAVKELQTRVVRGYLEQRSDAELQVIEGIVDEEEKNGKGT